MNALSELDPLWASAFVTIVLVLINVYYAWVSRQTVKEMQKARKVEFIPRIKASFHWAGPAFLELKAENVGKGPGFNIDAAIETIPKEEPRKWEQSVMVAGEHVLFFLPEGDLDALVKKYDLVSLRGSFKDIFGEDHEMNEELDVKELEKMRELKMVWREDPLRRIERHLNDIRKELRHLSNRLNIVIRRKKEEGKTQD